jgi:D-glycero-D-manno-heptose 1,7-bisphosphate phosphatase
VKAPEGAYVREPDELVLLPGAAAALARLTRAGLRTVLVTNQRWLSTPGADPDRYRATHARLVELLAETGGRLDAAYHCPHAAGACECRKPAPGLLLRAARELGLDPATAVIVGDAGSDIAAGRAAGTGTIRIGTGQDSGPRADATVPDVAAAVELLLAAPGADRRPQ